MPRGLLTRSFALSSFLLATFSAPALAQQVTAPCGIAASGDACIFDVEALASGVLAVDTRASIAGQRWRAAIAVAGAKAIKSAIGTGNTSTFTGSVSRKIAAGMKYEVVVFYERPLPSTFPTSLEVRFTGPVTVGAAREGPPLPIPERYVGRTDSTPFFSIVVAPDGLSVAEVRMTNHLCLGALTSFAVALAPDVAPILTGADGRPRFDARGIPFPFGTFDIEGALFDADGVDGNAEQALGGLSIVRTLGRCNSRWLATATPDSDQDGWNDTGEINLGSLANSNQRTPEHRDAPATPLYGPDSCHDLIDNDGDGLVDAADPDCMPPAGSAAAIFAATSPQRR
jgi:hypothetical protein